ncbi:putative ribonuclease H-like domain-containing protein [Tanacetum coccineum]
MSQPANDEFSQHLSDDEESNHEDASDTGAAPKQKQQVIPQTTAISNIKLPILKKEEYDLEYIDNDAWKVIQNGNSKKRISTGKDGVIRILPPVTAAEIQAVEKERKAKNILLMAIPKEHMRRFHGMDDAKEIWEAIRTSLEGLEKGYDRFQQLLSQLEAHGAEVSNEDANYKFLRSLPPAWSNLAMTMRTKPDVDTLSIDDFTALLPLLQPNPEKEVLAGFADEVIYSLFAKQSEDWDLLHEDLEQIDDLDIEEMDINWQIAMIAIRMKKFNKKTRESGNVQQRGHMMERRGETHFINTKKLESIENNQNDACCNGLCAGSIGTSSEHSIDTESEISSVPQNYNQSKIKQHLKLIGNWNAMMEREIGEGYFFTKKKCFVCGSLSHLIKDCDYYEKKMAREAELKKQRVYNTGNGVPVPVKTSNSFSPKRPQVNQFNQRRHFSKSHSPVRRPIVRNTARMTYSHAVKGNWGTAVKTSAGYNWRRTRPNSNYNSGSNFVRTDHPLKNMEDRGIFDSGCSGHMTGNKDHLDDFEECKGGSVTFGGSKGYITGKGRIRVGNLDFDSVSFVKELGHFNLFSISQICDKQHKVLFTETECLVVSPDFKMPDENQILLKVPRQHNMYSFDMKTPSLTKDYACLIAKATSDESKLWHRRLGHINFKNLNKLVKGNLVRGLPSKVFRNDHTCVACQKGKQHKASCKAKLERTITEPLHTLHMDLFGPTSVKSINHASYCLVITDDCTRFSWVFFLATKDETSGILQNFIRQIENQLNHRVKIIRSDNGTEFKNRDMLEFCGNKGIKQEYSNARTPQQNGVAERMNRTLIEAARTMLADSLLPTTFWAEAVSTACYIFNRVRVTKPQNKTPYELLFGHKPIISYIRPFGCHVTILDTLSVLGKFDGKCDEGFLVGYSLNSKAFRVYNLVTKKVEVNLHVKFLEEKPNVKGVGYRWKFDIDYLTDSMNYIPVSLDNQSNPHAGTSEVTNSAGTLQTPNANASEEADEDEELNVVPTKIKHSAAKVGPRKSSTNSKEEKDLDQLAQKHLREVTTDKATSTNSVNSGSEPANTQPADQDDSDMPELTIFNKPQKGIFDEASYDEEGMVHDFNNLPTEVAVSPIPTLRIHNIHPQSQILGDPKSSVQTRSRVKQTSGAHALEEPKKISEALKDDSWVEAMQEELLQLGCNRYGFPIDLPHRSKETKMALIKDEEAADVDVHLYRSMIAAASCCGQVLWIQNQMLDYGFNFMNTKIHIDNESTICIMKNPVYHSKTKHIEIRHHFIRDSYEKKLIRVEKIHTDFNVADLLTKAFDGPRLYLDCIGAWIKVELKLCKS